MTINTDEYQHLGTELSLAYDWVILTDVENGSLWGRCTWLDTASMRSTRWDFCRSNDCDGWFCDPGPCSCESDLDSLRSGYVTVTEDECPAMTLREAEYDGLPPVPKIKGQRFLSTSTLKNN